MSVKSLLCLSVLICAQLFAQDASQTIAFRDLSALVNEGPAVHISNLTYDIAEQKSKSELSWSNPELMTDIESVHNGGAGEREVVIGLGKHIKAPWTRRLEKGKVNQELLAAKNGTKDHALKALARVRTLYVGVQLARRHSAQMEGFQQVIRRASHIATDRKQAGILSGLQEQLLQMSMFNLNAALQRLQRETQRLETSLKTGLGIEPECHLDLSTPVNFISVQLDPPETYYDRLMSTFALTRFEHLSAAREKGISLARARLIPGIEISGGYKKVSDDLQGYAFGIALPLPLLNLNRAEIQQRQIEQRMVELQQEQYLRAAKAQLREKLVTIHKLSQFLGENAEPFKVADKIVQDLVFSFQQGWIDLGDLLDGIQLYSESLANYYEQLFVYYATLFEFEVLLGMEVLTL